MVALSVFAWSSFGDWLEAGGCVFGTMRIMRMARTDAPGGSEGKTRPLRLEHAGEGRQAARDRRPLH